MKTKRMTPTDAERTHSGEPAADISREAACDRAGITPGWKKSFWLRAIAALSAIVLIVAAFIAPIQVQVGYVLFSLAFCGVALAAVILLMTSLWPRRRRDEQLGSSP